MSKREEGGENPGESEIRGGRVGRRSKKRQLSEGTIDNNLLQMEDTGCTYWQDMGNHAR